MSNIFIILFITFFLDGLLALSTAGIVTSIFNFIRGRRTIARLVWSIIGEVVFLSTALYFSWQLITLFFFGK